MKKLRHILELIGMRFMLFMLDRLSHSASERMAIRIADIWFRIDRKRRRTAESNIALAKISSDSKEITRIARDSFRHFGVLIAESLKAGEIFTKDNWESKVDKNISPDALKLIQDPKQGVILVSGHIGNWEIAAQLLSFIKPVVGITRKMNNPYTDKLMNDRKPRNDFRLTPKHDANSLRLVSFLKKGEMLAILADQYAREHGVQINFFDTPTSTYTSPAMLHLVTGAPLCFGYAIRTGLMKYKFHLKLIETEKPSGDRHADVKDILDKINHELESAIRNNPEQYLWAHRRWRRLKATANDVS